MLEILFWDYKFQIVSQKENRKQKRNFVINTKEVLNRWNF